MADEHVAYRLRLPKWLYRDASDIALVYDESLNHYLTKLINRAVKAEFAKPEMAQAIEAMRAAREAR